MKFCSYSLMLLLFAVGAAGCGGSAGQPNPAAEAEAQKLNTDPSYEDQMMGGGEAAQN